MARMEYIRSLPIEIRRRKTYVMMDILSARANHHDGHWVFCSIDGKVALQSIQCLECGGYTMAVNLNISRNVLCSCDGFMDYYLDQILECDRQEAMEGLEGDTDEEDNYDVDDYNDF
jgi:hypothetical protein